MPAGNTYEAIASTTLGSATASVTFSSISGAYTDLVLITSLKGATTSNLAKLQFNADTGANYSNTYLEGDGTNAYSGRRSSGNQIFDWANYVSTVSTFSADVTNIMNYSNTTTYKTTLSRANRPTSNVTATVGLWRSTDAITSIVITANSGNFDTGSTFTLYGIKSA
jgi:hypothetical protein